MNQVLINEWPVSSTAKSKSTPQNVKSNFNRCDKQIKSEISGHSLENLETVSTKKRCLNSIRRKSVTWDNVNRHNELTDEPLVKTRVARWWRKNKPIINELPLPTSQNPYTVLFSVSQLPECRKYLEEEKRQLLYKLNWHVSIESSCYAALASIEDWLGNIENAFEYSHKATQLEPTDSEYKWLNKKLKKQYEIKELQKKKLSLIGIHVKIPEVMEVERVSAKDINKEDFYLSYMSKGKPVIIKDVVPSMTKYPITLDTVLLKAGDKTVTVKKGVKESVEWARLEDSRTMKVADFIAEVKENKTCDYLFDWSLPLHCPTISSDIEIPDYFSNNFLRKTSDGSLYKDSWPSLFVAPAGVVSNLHVDAFASHFWMALFQGKKRWTFFQPEETPLLYPAYINSLDPVFKVDLAGPDLEKFPLYSLARPSQCVLEEGELLFVPAGSPHYVENLENSVAISSNYVDDSNYAKVCEELETNALVDPRAEDLLQQFDRFNSELSI